MKVAAGHIAGDWTKIRFQGRRGAFNILSVACQTEVIAQETIGLLHSDCIIGDPNSLSDARLKTEVTPVSGIQALDVLNQIQGCTYERADLDQRRLGLIAQEVEQACTGLGIDNVTSTKWVKDDQYKVLDYSRLVSLLIPAVNTLAKRVGDLESKLNGSSS